VKIYYLENAEGLQLVYNVPDQTTRDFTLFSSSAHVKIMTLLRRYAKKKSGLHIASYFEPFARTLTIALDNMDQASVILILTSDQIEEQDLDGDGGIYEQIADASRQRQLSHTD